jgi:hypothetical protein
MGSSMARAGREPPQEPPRDAKNEELGRSREERDRHLRYAHEQYAASGQGRFGAPKGRKLPLQTPPKNAEHYPPGSRMPWPPDETIESDAERSRRPKGRGRS